MKQIRSPLTGTPLSLPGATQPRGYAQDMPLHPADELAQIRAELRKLHAREDELRRFFREDAPDQDLSGDAYDVTVTQHRKRQFDTTRLPQAILSNPRFYRDETRTYITTTPKPCRRPFQTLLPGMTISEEDEMDVFEVLESLPH